MAPDRQPKMRAMILAEDEAGRREVLEQLLPLQQADFEGLFEAMGPRPVTIRLLDPPLHEFLPDQFELHEQLVRARIGERTESPLEELEREFERLRSLSETNPMLGTRGVRLGLLYPEVYEMQVRAMARAVASTRERTGTSPTLEIMIPLVAYEGELELARARAVAVASEEGLYEGADYTVGTMIELPRACMIAGLIAAHADFFSFGTNDLTQAGIGLSRDDVEAQIIPRYMEEKILDRSPFQTLDGPGIGRLVRIATGRGRNARPELKLGICGEHGGDPDSIAFFDELGLDYVSCSPFRLPVARVAAAQAALRRAVA